MPSNAQQLGTSHIRSFQGREKITLDVRTLAQYLFREERLKIGEEKGAKALLSQYIQQR